MGGLFLPKRQRKRRAGSIHTKYLGLAEKEAAWKSSERSLGTGPETGAVESDGLTVTLGEEEWLYQIGMPARVGTVREETVGQRH